MSLNKQPKILHIIKTLSLGGAESNLFNLLQPGNMAMETHVAYSFGGDFEQKFLGLRDIGFFKYSSGKHKVQSLASLLIIWKLSAYIRKNKISIVHTHNYNGHIWGLMAAKMAGAKVIEHVHDFRYEDADYLRARNVHPGQFKQAVCFAKKSDRIIVLTENNKKYLIQRGVSADKIKVLRNGIPLGDIPYIDRGMIKASLGLPENKKIILFAARLSPEKNAQTVIRIAERMSRDDVVIVIAGSGPQKAALESGLSDAVKGRVKFIGFYPRVTELMSVADVFIQPTLLELHSITMLEAMKMSVPSIVSAGVGCNDEFVTDRLNGFLLDPMDADAWAKKISELLSDPMAARKMGQEGRRLVEGECNIQNTAKKLELVYQEILS